MNSGHGNTKFKNLATCLLHSPSPLRSKVAEIGRNKLILLGQTISGEIVKGAGRGAVAPERATRVVEGRHS